MKTYLRGGIWPVSCRRAGDETWSGVDSGAGPCPSDMSGGDAWRVAEDLSAVPADVEGVGLGLPGLR